MNHSQDWLDAGQLPIKEFDRFKPSQVDLSQLLLGTLDHIEVEATAAIIVKVLAMNGDAWRPASGEELAEGFDTLTKNKGFWRDWFNNPFIRVDPNRLVSDGFAEWDTTGAIQFTEAGLIRMSKWVTQV